MLPVNKLIKKLSEAYDHALNERIEEFRKLDAEINSMVPHYIQHITYSSSAIKSLNMVQTSTLFTQITKVTATLVGLSIPIAVLLYIPVLENFISIVLASIIAGVALIYFWKKIPILRTLLESTHKIDSHSTNLYVSLAECISSLEEIKGFHHTTTSVIEEWQRKGLWETKQDKNEIEEATKSIDKFLEELSNREYYESDDDKK